MSPSRIRDLRKAAGWTQERLANSSGIAVRTIQRIEAGDAASLETLTALARTLSVPVKDLLTSADVTPIPATDRPTGHLIDPREPELLAQQRHPGSGNNDGNPEGAVPDRRGPHANVRLAWMLGTVAAVLLVGMLTVLGYSSTSPGTGTIRVEIGAGSRQRLVDVALIDADGQEYAGNNQGAGQSEELQLIPAGRVQVNVGVCSVPALVHPGRTTTIRFDPADCIR